MICFIRGLLFFIIDFFRYLIGDINLLIWTEFHDFEGEGFSDLKCKKCGKISYIKK